MTLLLIMLLAGVSTPSFSCRGIPTPAQEQRASDPSLSDGERFDALWPRCPINEATALALLRAPLRARLPLFAARIWLQLPLELRRQPTLVDRVGENEDQFRLLLALGLASEGALEEAKFVAPPLDPERADVDPLSWFFARTRKVPAWEAACALRARFSAEFETLDWEVIEVLMPYVSPFERLLNGLPEEARAVNAPPLNVLEAARIASGRRVCGRLQCRPAASRPVSEAVLELAPFRAHAQDGGSPLVALPPNDDATDAIRPPLPPEFVVIRKETSGTTTNVLAASHRVDPTGELSVGGLWLLQSSGDRWVESYLGGGLAPAIGQPNSLQPIVVGDLVRVVGSREPNILLEAPLALLKRDSDGDGLSDLLEDRLLLNSRHRDSDGDGLPDSTDSAPRVSSRNAPNPNAELLTAFFRYFASGANAPRAVRLGRIVPNTTERWQFVIAEPLDLAGVVLADRTVNLTEAEMKRARTRFGNFFALRFSLHTNGRDHAFVTWSEGWRGGSVRIDRASDGTLRITELGNWVT